ncbi:MAG: hypothetical protein UX86_C0002G0020 [Candidatus Amesbacteria bacterium GW2011_GWC1_47_15]|uniref:Glycosyltransferase RgtA/B/C/D-like domain-containing protein n=3 Tax=Candidatus Amesiibacteriota TaxID=1752730 RepID=A0A1F4ZX00_9BACT|nr:MAG: hypothetical protein UX86_C0002G0020 [Candidatus Amesbacteria bacterium GW2011_GWC1_47_15]KKU97522.1 MAG: hypothetical protein UY28_C0019G0005 [Candidatus Amesbacteria bacterium GW2011_GWB1_48_13]OGD10366.1 MAG: hypothetical protein A2395_04390 [Candidatus Amesbacteria bacterium RIFOXYB1_FULL_47_9]
MNRRAIYYIILFCFLAFSLWLMFGTFSYDPAVPAMLISDKVWSDFGSHIPLIRSFSYGSNWPGLEKVIEHPLYPGEPIRYHPLFYILVGFLEKSGLRIDWSLNLLSSLGLFLVLYFIFRFGKIMYERVGVSLLAVIFFLFNGSFSFLNFFKNHPFSLNTLKDITVNTRFPVFGPWDGGPIVAFWNLNIYTNQRHLAFSFAIGLWLIYYLYRGSRRMAFFAGFVIGSFLLLNHAVFAVTLLFVAWFFITRPDLRVPLIFSGFGFLPWLALFRYTILVAPSLRYVPGFLTPAPLTAVSFIRFWFLNFGLHTILVPLGIILSPRPARIFVIPLLVLFIVPNLFQLSPDMINNHKFFNFFLIFGSLYSAYAVFSVFRVKYLGKVVAPLLIIFLTLGGIIDFFPVKNDDELVLNDVSASPVADYFFKHTPKDAVVLNSFWFYHPASLAGRYIYNGYSYFTWSYGYDQDTREKSAIRIYEAASKPEACYLMHEAGISYVELSRSPEGFLDPNFGLWDNDFTPAFTDPQTGGRVFSVGDNCV